MSRRPNDEDEEKKSGWSNAGKAIGGLLIGAAVGIGAWFAKDVISGKCAKPKRNKKHKKDKKRRKKSKASSKRVPEKPQESKEVGVALPYLECSKCTFRNPLHLEKCSVCGSKMDGDCPPDEQEVAYEQLVPADPLPWTPCAQAAVRKASKEQPLPSKSELIPATKEQTSESQDTNGREPESQDTNTESELVNQQSQASLEKVRVTLPVPDEEKSPETILGILQENRDPPSEEEKECPVKREAVASHKEDNTSPEPNPEPRESPRVSTVVVDEDPRDSDFSSLADEGSERPSVASIVPMVRGDSDHSLEASVAIEVPGIRETEEGWLNIES